jgi:hypothetical protein
MKTFFRLPLLVVLCLPLSLKSQNKPGIEFGKLSASDFSIEGIKADTSYGAVIIADIGKSSFAGNSKGWFTLVYKHQRRIRIINNKGFDIATVKIPLYNSVKTEDEEKLESFKASTYNLVDGKVVETKLQKEDLFKEVLDKNHSVRKFTMPALREGSIIEYSYIIKSDFLFNLQPWSFQGAYPRLWSEYELNLPSFFEYVFLAHGYHPFHIKESKEKSESYSVSEEPDLGYATGSTRHYSVSSNNMVSRWVMKDVPHIKEERFTSSIDNHISRIEFQMSGQRFPNVPFRDIMGSWVSAAAALMKDEDFGADFNEDNYWLTETIKTLNLEDKATLEKAKIIYYFIQKNFSSKGLRGIYLSQKLKETLKRKQGYVSDINMLLTLMLKNAGITANPVLLSTRANGWTTETYPLIRQYDYVVAKAIVDGKPYYLDASKSSLGFNRLPKNCYNGSGISIIDSPITEPIYPDTITESKNTFVMLNNDSKDKKWSGNFSSSLGYYESFDIREDVAEKGQQAYINTLKETYTDDFSIDSVLLDSIENKEAVINVSYSISINTDGNNNLIYFNPMLKEGIKENYFKSSERNYPVELPYKMDETYVIHIPVPEGYDVDELPKSARVTLSEGDGGFEYNISKTATAIILRTRLSLNKTTFGPDEYEGLKNFFDYVVKKHAEQIVFKKK